MYPLFDQKGGVQFQLLKCFRLNFRGENSTIIRRSNRRSNKIKPKRSRKNQQKFKGHNFYRGSIRLDWAEQTHSNSSTRHSKFPSREGFNWLILRTSSNSKSHKLFEGFCVGPSPQNSSVWWPFFKVSFITFKRNWDEWKPFLPLSGWVWVGVKVNKQLFKSLFPEYNWVLTGSASEPVLDGCVRDVWFEGTFSKGFILELESLRFAFLTLLKVYKITRKTNS